MKNKVETFKLSGRVYLLLAISIFGAANAITRKLNELGAENLVDGRNPISFCNVLFVGNLCALALLGVLYRHQWRLDLFRRITWRNWLALSSVAFFGTALVPTLVFTALSITTVNNVVLIGQIDTPIILGLSVLLLRERVNGWVIGGAAVSFVGVVLTVLLQPATGDAMTVVGIDIGRGELLTLLAAVFQSVSSIISKVSLQQVPLSIFSGFRMFVGTIIFFVAAILLYEPSHFMDVSSPFLWRWMLVYAAVIVVGGQLFWFKGLKRSTAGEVSLAAAFNPIAGVLAAYTILGEIPTIGQYVGGSVILFGIALNQIGLSRLSKVALVQLSTDKQMDGAVGFKGI
ncbi:permease of the drug/metabolite transporter (DMT) superfamily [Rubidibacter lacunae KORDI 51-2]|uniref:Permease of the drug/metabolite transporter (DMT) superfamily n=1 Tax=Rubidibacter lacunae KORDI 51-2 TaxID=582515 RepID=U5DPU9_9CHRO|nr:DMT family transporter [Rubidibacter lacunae]ERN42619.1 permease of the drug/metabolite transporter (DMT) superfamily [Rubidibacter lacunae KORDI 51-2]